MSAEDTFEGFTPEEAQRLLQLKLLRGIDTMMNDLKQARKDFEERYRLEVKE